MKKRAKRKHGEGTFYTRKERRKDGTTRVIHVAEIMHEGKRRRLYGASLLEVREKLQKLSSEIRLHGGIKDESRVQVGEWLDYWLATNIQPNIEPQSIPTLKRAIELRIKPNIGTEPLKNLTTKRVEMLYSELRANGVSDRLMVSVHRVLSAALKKATEPGHALIAHNPMDYIRTPRYRAGEMEIFSREQSLTFMGAARGDQFEALFLLAVLLGIRLGELLGLRWSDLSANTLTVQRTIVVNEMENNAVQIKEYPKTFYSRRRLNLTDTLLSALERRRALTDDSGRALLFPDDQERPMYRTDLYRRWYYPLLKRAGLPHLKFHGLRHTAASLMLAAGVHIKVVSEILGHASAAVTLNVYSHLVPGIQADAMTRLEDYLKDSPQGSDRKKRR